MNKFTPPCSICRKTHPGYYCISTRVPFVDPVAQANIDRIRADAYRAGRLAQAEEDAKVADEIAKRAYWQTIGGLARGEAAREIAAILRGNAVRIQKDPPAN